MITQYEFSLIHRFLMQNSMISHYFGIFEAMYHWEENDSYLSKNMPIVTWYVDPESRRFRGSIDGPPPGLLQSKCFLVFIGDQYLDKLGEVMEKVKSVGKAVRMGHGIMGRRSPDGGLLRYRK